MRALARGHSIFSRFWPYREGVGKLSRQLLFPRGYPDGGLRLLRLPPATIDTAGSWLPWSEAPSPELKANVERWGILHPILVDASADRPVLLDGLARLQLAQATEHDLLALDVGPLSPSERLIHHLAANFHKPPTEARLIAACRAATSLGSTVEEALAILHLHPKTKTARLLADWLTLPPTWDTWLARGHACLAAAPLLARLTAEERAAVEPLLAAYAWSQGALINLLSWLTEAACRDNVPMPKLVAQLSLEDVHQLSPQDAMARLLAVAKRLRYPERSRLEARWSEAVRALHLPAPWQIHRTDEFETGTVELRLRIAQPAEVAAAAAALAQQAQSTAWQDILEVGRA